MKTHKLIELTHRRGELIREARSLLTALKAETNPVKAAELEARHETVMRDFDINQLDIQEAEMEASENEARASNRPGMGAGEAFGVDEPGQFLRGQRSDWIDERGKPVRVLARGDRFADRRGEGPSMGDLIRAKIAGPRNEAEQRALSESVNSAGGFTVPDPLAAEFIDNLRSQSVVMQAGAMTVPMASETLAIARAIGDPAVAWRNENAAVAETDPTYDRVTFTARTLAGGVKMSRELAQDSINIGAMVQQQLAAEMARKLDLAALFGSGTAPEPRGIANTVGINSVAMGANGAAISSYDRLLDAIYELTLNNIPAPFAAVMHPRTQLALQKLKETSTAAPLAMPPWVANTPAFITTSAPITETQGTATNASSILFGNYSMCLIGMRQQVEIRIFDQTFADNGQLYVQAWLRADVQLAQPKAFTKLVGIIP
jgi:HK97 family phage major capsid protein